MRQFNTYVLWVNTSCVCALELRTGGPNSRPTGSWMKLQCPFWTGLESAVRGAPREVPEWEGGGPDRTLLLGPVGGRGQFSHCTLGEWGE